MGCKPNNPYVGYFQYMYFLTRYKGFKQIMFIEPPHMSMFANTALLGGGVRVRVWIILQRKIKRRSKALLRL